MGCNGVAVNVAEKMAKKENTITIIDGQADNFLIIEERRKRRREYNFFLTSSSIIKY